MISQIISKLENKKIAILGFGKEGQSTYQFIRENKPTMSLTILDHNTDLQKDENLLKDQNLTFILGENYLSNLEEYDLIIKTPGISLKDINIQNIKSKITSQMELLLEVNCQNVIGITGTKGKSTTTSLIYEIIKDQNKNVVLVGNIGIPIFSVLNQCDKNTIFVTEMSSHQLEFIKVSPHIGIVLNLFEDHLDHAGSVEHYHNIKLNMFKYQTKEDVMIYCSDNENLNKLINQKTYQSKAFAVNLKDHEPADVYKKETQIYFQNNLLYQTTANRNLLGNHNIENISVALLVGNILGLNQDSMLKVVENFKPLAYRMEKVGEINKVSYYVDTLATIPFATIETITALKDVNTLIFGGQDRGIDYTPLTDYLKNSEIEHFICMPTTAHKISTQLPQNKVFLVQTLEEAVALAKEITKENTICLLSPAAPSYDQFKNYQEKGDKFKEYVLKN